MSRSSDWLFSVAVVYLVSIGQSSLFAEDWPQWRGQDRDGVWHAEGLASELPDGQLPLLWSTEIGAGYSGPTVSQGHVYVMDRPEGQGKQTERVLCLDSTSGKIIWVYEYEAAYTISYTAGPRASVTIDNGKAYAVGAMGDLFCFEAKTGKIVWKRDLKVDYEIEMPIWGIAASPLIYKNLLIQQVAGANGACMVAFEKDTGKEVWKSLNDRAGYSSPIIIQQAGQDVLVCWSGDSVSGLSPVDGKVYWSHPMPSSRMPIGIVTPTLSNEMLFVSSFYDGSMMVSAPKNSLSSELVWREVGPDEQHTKSLHTMIGNPILRDGFVYGFDSYGELRCLEASTGKRLWEDLSAVPKARWSTVHMVTEGSSAHARVWMFNERGEILITKLSPQGLTIIDRANLIEPTKIQLGQRGGVCWTHPAFAEGSIFARNDNRIVKASLAK